MEINGRHSDNLMPWITFWHGENSEEWEQHRIYWDPSLVDVKCPRPEMEVYSSSLTGNYIGNIQIQNFSLDFETIFELHCILNKKMCLWNMDANKVKIQQNLQVLHFNPALPHKGMWCPSREQPLDELTVQVWFLNQHPITGSSFKYCTLYVGGWNYGQANSQLYLGLLFISLPVGLGGGTNTCLIVCIQNSLCYNKLL